MALKAKSNEIDESFDDEDSKMNSYITRQLKKFMRMPMRKDLIKTESNLVLFNLRAKTEEKRILRLAVSTLFSLDQSALDVKVLDT